MDIIQQYGDWYTGRWWVGCTFGTARKSLDRLRSRPVTSSLYQMGTCCISYLLD